VRNRWRDGKFVVMKTAAGGSTGVNRARGNGARRREIACICYFKMLTLPRETSIFARTAEINFYYLMTLFCDTQFKRAEVN